MIKYFSPFFFLLLTINSIAQLKISSALCENKKNPAGVPIKDIHFAWQLESSKRGAFQTAYQLVIASSKENLQKQLYNIFDAPAVKKSESINVPYAGKTLYPGETYFWRVRVWDNQKNISAWSEIQSFTTGLFDKNDWGNAKWIGYEELPDSMKVSPGIHSPEIDSSWDKCLQRTIIPYFRKNFSINKKVAKAIAFVTGLGQYEMSINGKKVSADFLSPGWTDYDKRCLYNMYDVTSMLANNKNTIGIIAGNGFYNINRERYYKFVVASGAPKIICKINITYTDGSTASIVSDESWKTAPSPITYTSIYGGEDYNATLEQNGWNETAFNDGRWKNAIAVKAPGGSLQPETDFPVQVMDTIAVKKIMQLHENIYLYDFAQNASGIIQLKVKGNKGDTIKLTPAELIDNKNIPNQNASGSPYYFTYILKGNGIENWQPKFSYYGFRYVLAEIIKHDSATNKEHSSVISLSLLHTRNSTSKAGTFSCSDTLFNQINALIQWAIKSNMQSIITDCPHREKLGWLEQDYLMGNSIHYNYNIQLLYKKLVTDMIDAQTADGLVPDIAPEFVVFKEGFRDSPEWGSACVILPWLLYEWYGDTETMKQAYNMMKKYVAYLESKSPNHILSYGLGDWYDYGPNFPGEAQLTPKALTATAIYYYDVLLLSKMAALMEDKNDHDNILLLSREIKTAFNQKFFNAQNKVYATGSQTAMAMPLCVGLVEEKDKKKVLENLIDSIHHSGKALTAGDIGFHFLIQALDDGGASQLIYEMNNRNDVPGYGYQLKKGATALTESWQALEEVSNNHLMLGHIMEWFYSGLAGISQEENSVAFKHIKIRPQPVGTITSAKGNFNSPYGLITSEWKKEKDGFSLHILIPVNTTATVYLPAISASKIFESGKPVNKNDFILSGTDAVINITSGEYWFAVK
jgi:alpha-L-rhamnosidase